MTHLRVGRHKGESFAPSLQNPPALKRSLKICFSHACSSTSAARLIGIRLLRIATNGVSDDSFSLPDIIPCASTTLMAIQHLVQAPRLSTPDRFALGQLRRLSPCHATPSQR